MTPDPARGRRILVVDDDPLNLELARIILRKHGYHVETASSGEAAFERAMASPFDAILSDIQMPGMDGVQFRHLIRAHAALAAVPVILISSALEEERARRRNHDLDKDCVSRTADLREAIEALAAAMDAAYE
jgi:CheY-like chemotaxis protein